MAQETTREDRTQVQQRPDSSKAGKRGTARIEVKVELDLDDMDVFDLRGDGIKTTTVVSN